VPFYFQEYGMKRGLLHRQAFFCEAFCGSMPQNMKRTSGA
jgi:hypothetical protein